MISVISFEEELCNRTKALEDPLSPPLAIQMYRQDSSGVKHIWVWVGANICSSLYTFIRLVTEGVTSWFLQGGSKKVQKALQVHSSGTNPEDHLGIVFFWISFYIIHFTITL